MSAASKPVKKTSFVISPIGELESETRKRSDKVLKHIITPSLETFGYEVIRADKISEPGIITSQVIQYVVDSPLVVADLTEHNPNVFYELALRHAIKKPLIQIIKKGEQIPFDVAATRIILFDIQDLDSVEQAKSEIGNQIKSIEGGKTEIDSPISISLDLKLLKESSDPEQRSLADVVEAITDLRGAITLIDKKINNPEGLINLEMLEQVSQRLKKSNLPSNFEGYINEVFYSLRELISKLNKLIKSKKVVIEDLTPIKQDLDRNYYIVEELMMRIRRY